jgi:hypothetical protein
MNLADLREAVRVKTGYPERGPTGTTRLNKAINYALRHLWGEMPEALLKEQHRFRLEPSISGQATIHYADRFTWYLPSSASSAVLATDGTLSARNFEVQGTDGNWYQFRIREVRRVLIIVDPTVPNPVPVLRDLIIVDKPWFNNTDAGIAFRIYTDAYPYPGDIQRVRTIVYNPEVEPRELPISAHPEEMARMRLGYGWRNSGRIEFAASGDWYQQPAPHYTPTVTTIGQPANANKWGYDATGSERGTLFSGRRYGAAGTFSYRVCHVWGRLPAQFNGVIDPDTNPDVAGEQTGRLAPFYISSPSPATEQVSTVWGGGAIAVATPNVGYQYGSTNSSLHPSYQRSGVQKYIFRARHATQSVGVSNADVTALENDGIYYLWKVVDGNVTSVQDKGDGDPVERSFPLKDFHGHFHIRFDKAADAAVPMLLYVVKRPPTLDYDTDAPNLPPECFEAITELTASYLTGDRDGSVDRKSMYYQSYLSELNRLKRIYSFPGFVQGPFGDGLDSKPRGMFIGGPIRSA